MLQRYFKLNSGWSFFLYWWRRLGSLTAIAITLGFGTKTHWTTVRLCQLVHEEPTTISNLDFLKILATILFPVEADQAINNPISHFGMGGGQPTGDCSSTSHGRNTGGSHLISGGRKKPVPSTWKDFITRGACRGRFEWSGAILVVQFRIDFALLFWRNRLLIVS